MVSAINLNSSSDSTVSTHTGIQQLDANGICCCQVAPCLSTCAGSCTGTQGGDYGKADKKAKKENKGKEEATIDPEIDSKEILDDIEDTVKDEAEDAGIEGTKSDLVDKVKEMADKLIDTDKVALPDDEEPSGSDDESKDDEILKPVDDFVLPGDEDPSGSDDEKA